MIPLHARPTVVAQTRKQYVLQSSRPRVTAYIANVIVVFEEEEDAQSTSCC